ncbi:MAG: rRNA maturation RNase YbeY [Saprospiraceae bacterium]
MSIEPVEEKIIFYSEDIEFNLPNQSTIFDWINLTIQNEAKVLSHLNFIFCSDAYLHKINIEYLNHDTLTDVITFPYAEGKNIEGDIFISIDRIRENAKSFDVSFGNELHRVMIHGTLHLLGYLDKTADDKTQMTQKENEYLAKLNGMKLDKQ